MVKNTCGGNKHKSQARKTVIGSKQSGILRLSKDNAELYAQVIKIFGGTLFSAICIDGVVRNCVIRGKFRSKRDCIINPGSWILVGLREYVSIKKDTTETCDLLEVYGDLDKEKLKTQQPTFNWKIFASSTGTFGQTSDVNDDTVRFTNATDEEDYRNIMKKELSGDNENEIVPKKMTVVAFGEEDEINVDDI